MRDQVFHKTLFISLLGHITVFSIFSLSFGNKTAGLADIYFLGGILRRSDLIKNYTPNDYDIKEVLTKKSGILTLTKTIKGHQFIVGDYLKPQVTLISSEYRIASLPKIYSLPFIQKRKESVIMFYPPLPYNFTLYFKDRQVAHIELMFNIISIGANNSIAVKRKISSGSLEADLLGMRYIKRYLFMQRIGITPNKWQTVKIDLSTRND